MPRNPNALSINQKKEILDKLDIGITHRIIQDEYNTSKYAIQKIKYHREKILKEYLRQSKKTTTVEAKRNDAKFSNIQDQLDNIIQFAFINKDYEEFIEPLKNMRERIVVKLTSKPVQMKIDDFYRSSANNNEPKSEAVAGPSRIHTTETIDLDDDSPPNVDTTRVEKSRSNEKNIEASNQNTENGTEVIEVIPDTEYLNKINRVIIKNVSPKGKNKLSLLRTKNDKKENSEVCKITTLKTKNTTMKTKNKPGPLCYKNTIIDNNADQIGSADSEIIYSEDTVKIADPPTVTKQKDQQTPSQKSNETDDEMDAFRESSDSGHEKTSLSVKYNTIKLKNSPCPLRFKKRDSAHNQIIEEINKSTDTIELETEDSSSSDISECIKNSYPELFSFSDRKLRGKH